MSNRYDSEDTVDGHQEVEALGMVESSNGKRERHLERSIKDLEKSRLKKKKLKK